MAAHRKSDRRRVYLYAVGLGKCGHSLCASISSSTYSRNDLMKWLASSSVRYDSPSVIHTISSSARTVGLKSIAYFMIGSEVGSPSSKYRWKIFASSRAFLTEFK